MKRISSWSFAARFAGYYAVFAVLWIFFTERLLLAITVADVALLYQLQTYKGLAFVGATALFLYALLDRELRARRKAEELLYDSEARLRLITDNMQDMVAKLDKEGCFLYASPSHQALLGYAPKELQGKSAFLLVHPDDLTAFRVFFQRGIRTGLPEKAEFRMRNAAGNCFWVECFGKALLGGDGDFTGAIINSRDISERKAIEEQLKYSSMHDALTGLYNRAYFDQEMRRLESGRHNPVGIIVCDVDGLKVVNDNYGHAAGDTLLKAAAAVIQKCFREADVVARIGGDEVAVLLPESSSEAVEEACCRIRAAVEEYNNQGESGPKLSLSVGFAAGEGQQVAEHLFKKADDGMYCDKLQRSSRYAYEANSCAEEVKGNIF